MPSTFLTKTTFRILVLNLGVALVLTIALALVNRGLPWVAVPVGIIALVLPGLNLALTLEQLAQRRESPAILMLWAFVCSLTLTPGVTYALGQTLLAPFLALWPLLAFVSWWLISLAVFLIVSVIRRIESGVSLAKPSAATWRECWPLALAFGGVLLANFFIYPFIPEADSYTYLILLDGAEANPGLVTSDPRAFFLVLVQLGGHLLGIDPYWVLKCLLPLGVVFQVLTVYLIARPLIRDQWARAFVALSPLYFPVVLQESLIARPQSIFFLAVLPVLYLVGLGLSERRGLEQLYWLVTLLAVCFIGLRTHTLFTFLLPVVLLGFIDAARPTVKRYPLESTLVLTLLAILLWPWLSATRLIGDSARLFEIIGDTFRYQYFTLWFIDQYRNVDGAELGWPGWSAALYYGYNLGLFFPALILTVLVRARSTFRALLDRLYWPAWLGLSFFFLIAEILPRFGLAYLPDRAWLFLALIACLSVPVLVRGVTAGQRRASLVGLLLVAGALSVGVGTGLTYAKQGWMTRAEARARDFIRHETPSDAIFLGQGGHHVLVRYLGRRTLIRPPGAVFLSDDTHAVEAFLASQAALAAPPPGEQAAEQRATIANRLGDLADTYRQDTAHAQSAVIAVELRALAGSVQMRPTEAGADENAPIPTSAPVYLIYSRDKFNSLYGSRSWYRTSNFYGANLLKFSPRYPIVYQAGGTTIWKVRD